MRGLASTIALVLVLAGLGAYIYFVDVGRPAATGVEGEPPRTKVFEVENDKINEIKITAKGETTLLRKAESGWTIVEPMAVDADPPEVIGIATAPRAQAWNCTAKLIRRRRLAVAWPGRCSKPSK